MRIGIIGAAVLAIGDLHGIDLRALNRQCCTALFTSGPGASRMQSQYLPRLRE
jgi:hypothetical protein